jgi:membrane-associated phospholipid phosphatase
MQFVWNAELAINLFLQNLGSWLTLPMQVISGLGQEDFFIAVMPALFWCIDTDFSVRLGIMLLASASLNCYVKILFHSPRPFWFSDSIKPLSMETSFGFPSGHAQNSLSIWGLMSVYVKRNWFWALSAAVVLLVGLSRIYLGMHFATDVLGGWLIGAALVFLFLRLDAPAINWLKQRNTLELVGLAVLSSLLLIAFQFLAMFPVQNWSMPSDWLSRSNPQNLVSQENPFSINSQVTSAGIWLGMLLGVIFTRRRGGFDTRGSIQDKLARYAAGIFGVGLLYLGLAAIMPHTDDLVGQCLRYFRYALIGFWVTGAAPYLFIRFGWAKVKSSDNPPI